MWTCQGRYFYRSQLTEQGKKFYDYMCQQYTRKQYSTQFILPVIDFSSAKADAFAAYDALYEDHPEFFYLSRDRYVSSTRRRTVLLCSRLYSPDKIAQIQKELTHLTEVCKNEIRGMNDLEKEIHIYGKIAAMLRYEDQHLESDHNIVGPLLQQGKAVCEGMNALFILCMREAADIPCIKVISSNSHNGSKHCWALLQIQGRTVHCDLTWDCTGHYSDHRPVFYDYLNLSDRQLQISHDYSWESFIPKCSTEYLCYYNYYAQSFETMKQAVKYILSRLQAFPNKPVYFRTTFPITVSSMEESLSAPLSGLPGDFRFHLDEKLKHAVVYKELVSN